MLKDVFNYLVGREISILELVDEEGVNIIGGFGIFINCMNLKFLW